MPANGEPLASAIIHDVRGRFAALQPYIQLLQEEGIGPLNEQQRECLEVIERTTEALFIATVGLLELLRDDLDGLPLSVAPVPLSKVLKATALLLKHHGVAAEIAEPGEDPGEVVVAVEASRIARILSALAVRAASHDPHPLAITATAGPDEHFVTVGVGPRPDREAAGEVAERDREAAVTRLATPDVGLTLAASLLERQGGRLRVEGERFSVLLPLATPDTDSEAGRGASASAAADDTLHASGR